MDHSGSINRLSPLAKRETVVDVTRARTNLDVVRMCCDKLGFTEYSRSDPERIGQKPVVDIHWHAGVYADMKEIVKSGKVNKFPGMNEITKKVSLTRSLNVMERMFPEAYDFYPRSWFIPHQLDEFYSDFYDTLERNGNKIPWYIVKPDEGCQGNNIYLVHTPEDLKNTNEPQLIQEYVSKPHLLNDNLKYDLRVYAVIKSLHPLSIYIAREGMVRFCTVQYRPPSMGNSAKTYMHLTNYSLNKHNENFSLPDDLKGGSAGNKRLLTSVMHQMGAKGIDTGLLWHKIKGIIVKTILAMIPEIIIYYEKEYGNGPGPSCFQILGFDILLKENLDPVLLEVNACPSLTIAGPGAEKENYVDSKENLSVVDLTIKFPLVRDTLRLVTGTPLPPNLRDKRQPNGIKPRSWDDIFLSAESDEASLTEIFPSNFGNKHGTMLFLHRAVYLFMHSVDNKTMQMSNLGVKTFLRKCNLAYYLPTEELEETMKLIHQRWEGYNVRGLPFHGFLDLLMCIAERKYPAANPITLRRLLHECEHSLRYQGVSTNRLRPDRESLASAHERGRPMTEDKMEIYLLPSQQNSAKKRRQVLPKI